MSHVIFCLTRGYANPSMYARLITRNKSIVSSIGTKYKLVLFHEGNITDEHQAFISSHTPELTIQWISVKLEFFNGPDVPQETIATFYDGSCYPGYHAMCEFHTCHVWEYLKEYEKVLRIDEDCVLSGDWSTVFEIINDDVPYGTPSFDIETHDLTNKTLIDWYRDYDKSMPYTNVFITKMSVWFRKDIQEFIQSVKQNRGCIRFRWGDAPLHGVILKKFSVPFKIMTEYSYFHGSHNRMVN